MIIECSILPREKTTRVQKFCTLLNLSFDFWLNEFHWFPIFLQQEQYFNNNNWIKCSFHLIKCIILLMHCVQFCSILLYILMAIKLYIFFKKTIFFLKTFSTPFIYFAHGCIFTTIYSYQILTMTLTKTTYTTIHHGSKW